MKIEQEDRQVYDLGSDNQVHVKYRLRLWGNDDNPIKNKQVRVFEGEQLIFVTDTDLDGEAEIELIVDIMNETRRQVTFAVDEERTDKVFLFEFGVKRIEARTKAKEEEQEALEDRKRKEQKALEDKKRKEQEALEDKKRKEQEALKDRKRKEQEALKDRKRKEQKACRNRVDECKRFFPHFGVGIVEEYCGEVVINEKGQLVSSNSFDGINDFGKLPVTVASKGTKFYLIDTNGEILSDWYDEIVLEEDKKIAKVRRGKKYNLIDINGELMFKKWIDAIEDCAIKGAWVLKFDDGYCVIDPKNRIIAHDLDGKNFSDVTPIREGLLKVKCGKEEYEINSKFVLKKIVEEDRLQKEEMQRLFAKAIEEKKMTDRLASCKRFFPHFGVGIVEEGSNEVLINGKGKLLGDAGFQQITDFGKLPVTVARKGTKFYLIDTNGKILSDWYDEIVLDEDRAVAKVKRGNKFALMNLDGKIILHWCDEIVPATIKDTWTVKKDNKYYLCVRLDDGNIHWKLQSTGMFSPLKDGIMMTINNGERLVVDSEFKCSKIVTFDEHLERLMTQKQLTKAESNKLRSIYSSYKTAVAGAKVLYPEVDVPTEEKIESELLKLGALELKDICKYMEKPILVIEPPTSFFENKEAINRIGSLRVLTFTISRHEKLFLDSCDSQNHPGKVTIFVAEGSLQNRPFLYLSGKKMLRASIIHQFDGINGKKKIWYPSAVTYQSMLAASIHNSEKRGDTMLILDRSGNRANSGTLLDSGKLPEIVFTGDFFEEDRLFVNSLSVNFRAFLLEDIVDMPGVRACMKLFEFDTKDTAHPPGCQVK